MVISKRIPFWQSEETYSCKKWEFKIIVLCSFYFKLCCPVFHAFWHARLIILVIFFLDPPQGQGSCGFQIWQDELHKNATPFVGCDNIGPVNADMVVDFNLISDEEPDNESHLNDTSINMNIPCPDVTTFGKMEQWNCQEDIADELLRTPSKESIAGDQKSNESNLDLGSLLSLCQQLMQC